MRDTGWGPMAVANRRQDIVVGSVQCVHGSQISTRDTNSVCHHMPSKPRLASKGAVLGFPCGVSVLEGVWAVGPYAAKTTHYAYLLSMAGLCVSPGRNDEF